MDKRSLLIGGGIGFLLGSLSMMYWTQSHIDKNVMQSQGLSQTHQNGSDSVPGKKEINQFSLQTPKDESTGNKANLPKAAGVVAISTKLEADLLRIVGEKTQKGIVQSNSTTENGGTFTHEKLPDGSEVDRTYGSNGILASEHSQFEGNVLDRSFYESGQTKAFRWILSDGTTVGAGVTAEGVYTFRVDEFPNGDKLSYEYDDRGNLTKKWLIKKDGKAVLVQ